ncbi:hypothetical protein FLAV_01793 [Flavobacteriales bacterium]|nr:hypothetical protein [Flavobacteriales bacterium]MCL4816917.1 DUF4783 domain-containing protein [Flavobacteriales bacterium]WKZ75975.1 MAG: DUF4783 domain-containing protein [Vicingaceae bacterium]GIK70415.1 MAG: hypothetical protein BroJett020_17100 [Bacteroidota bacterium]CAG0981475.1 hypothetical protein FLAV_01793 [Flavobacteriales bacterium]
MKLTITIFLLSISAFFFNPFPENDIFSNAFKTGNAKEISKYFGNSVDLNIPGSEGVYSKAQAEQILKDFFTKNTTKSYSSLHNGTSKDSHYAIGSLITAKGTFRTYVLYKKEGANITIQELRLEQE